MGAEFVHGRPADLWRRFEKLGLAPYDVNDSRWLFREGHWVEDPHFWREIASVFKKAREMGTKDISFLDFLHQLRQRTGSREARKLAPSFVEGFQAASLEKISLQSVADLATQPTLYRLAEGYSALAQAIKAGLDPRLARFHFESPIQSVRWQPHHVAVQI